MLPRLSTLIGLVSATLLTVQAQTPNVFVVPASGQAQAIPVVAGDSFTQFAANVVAQDAFQVITAPSGKNYFITRNSASTVVITDSSFNVLATRPKSLGTGATAAAMTPNGRYIIVTTSGTTYIIDTTSDAVVSQLATGSAIHVGISRDGARAYVLLDTG